jgi:hypothetical protein
VQTNNHQQEISVVYFFFIIFSLLRALSADALETARQENMLYSTHKFGNPDICDSNFSGFMKAFSSHCRTQFALLAGTLSFVLLSHSPISLSSSVSVSFSVSEGGDRETERLLHTGTCTLYD